MNQLTYTLETVFDQIGLYEKVLKSTWFFSLYAQCNIINDKWLSHFSLAHLSPIISQSLHKVSKKLNDQTVPPKTDVELSCVIPDGPETKTQWFKDGKPIQVPSAKYDEKVVGNKRVLVVKSASVVWIWKQVNLYEYLPGNLS